MDVAALQVAMQGMEARIEAMQAAYVAQSARLEEVLAARAAHPVPRAKIAPAPKYNGTTPPLDEWIATIHQQCVYHRITDDVERVVFGYGNLTGVALDWYDKPGAGGSPATWAAFESGLRERFQPVTTADTARAKMHMLKQGKQTVNDYVGAFRRLAILIPGTDDATMMFHFRNGLHPSVQLILLQQQPATLSAAITLAVRVGSAHGIVTGASSAMDLSALEAEMYGTELAPAPASSSRGDAPVGRAEVEAMLAAMYQNSGQRGGKSGASGRGGRGVGGGSPGQRGLPVISGFSEAKVRQYMEEGLCFGCGSAAHVSRNCPRRVVVNGRAAWPEPK